MRMLLFGATALLAMAGFVAPSQAQTVSPDDIFIDETDPVWAPVCADSSATDEACITLAPDSIVDKVDVFFLFDDTGSFSSFVPDVSTIFSGLVADLQTALPSVEFGFGVGRFEDYGGPGADFSLENLSGRPFILNQPIVTDADAVAGATTLATLVNDALARTAPGSGGDGPESAIAEGLYQVATGMGFDGDGDGLSTGLGGLQIAGAIPTQTAGDDSGDVPAFATLDPGVIHSGNVGGAGFRTGALRLVILATDICSIAAFPAGAPVPANITGTGGSELVGDLVCASDTGTSRFGFVGDAKSNALNTIPDAVVPSEAGTVQATIDALNAAGIRVLGMGPGAASVLPGSGPSTDESVFLSAVARLTGAVDGLGNGLVFDIGGGGDPLKDAIVAAIEATATLPIDVSLTASVDPLPDGLTLGIDPSVVLNVGPGETACFNVTFTGSGAPQGLFDLEFKDVASGAILGQIPVEAACDQVIEILVDVKPQSCPNPINCRKNGVTPVAVVGTAGFDVTQIDPDSVRLGGAAPVNWAYEDVTTPAGGPSDPPDCDADCTTLGADGFLDLTLKYDTQEVIDLSGLDELPPGKTCTTLEVTGNLYADFGGTPITGADSVRFQCK